ILLVRDGGRVVGIAPLMLTRGRLFGLPVRRLESMANNETPRYEFLVARDRPDVHGTIWRFLQQSRERWDLLQLTYLPEASPTMTELRRLAAEAELPVGKWMGDASPYLVFDGADPGAYQRAVSRKHRMNMNRLLRRLSERGRVDFELIESPERDPRALE